MQHNKDLSSYRLEMAVECLAVAKDNLLGAHYKSAANRSYYCIFHAMRSVLALEQLDFKRHSAVISHFRLHYIKTEKFNKASASLSTIIDDLFHARGRSDYDDFFVLSKDEVQEQIQNAEYFLEQVKIFLDKQP